MVAGVFNPRRGGSIFLGSVGRVVSAVPCPDVLGRGVEQKPKRKRRGKKCAGNHQKKASAH